MEIVKYKTCAVTGHRVLKSDFNREKLYLALDKLAQGGIDTFLVGMAVGFDTECFKCLEKIRNTRPIKIIACVPCPKQDLHFTAEQKAEYRRMLSVADETVMISETYTNKCMFLRNMFMVDNCSVLLAYITENKGGTFNTVNYAKRKGVSVLLINDINI